MAPIMKLLLAMLLPCTSLVQGQLVTMTITTSLVQGPKHTGINDPKNPAVKFRKPWGTENFKAVDYAVHDKMKRGRDMSAAEEEEADDDQRRRECINARKDAVCPPSTPTVFESAKYLVDKAASAEDEKLGEEGEQEQEEGEGEEEGEEEEDEEESED